MLIKIQGRKGEMREGRREKERGKEEGKKRKNGRRGET